MQLYSIALSNHFSFLRKTMLLFLLAASVITCKAQDDTYQSLDSLQQVLQKPTSTKEQAHLLGRISMIQTNAIPITAIQTALKGAAIAQSVNDSGEIAFCFMSAGWGYQKIGKDDSAKYYLQTAIDQFNRQHLYANEAKALLKICVIYQNEYNDAIALPYLIKAVGLFDSTHDPNNKAFAEKLIGINYRKQGLYDKAMIYTDSAIEGFMQLKKYASLADAFVSKGNIFSGLKKWDSAFIYYDQSLLYYKITHQSINPAYTYEDKADIYIIIYKDQPTKHYLDSAIDCYQKAYTIFKISADTADMAYEQLKIGQTLLLTGKHAAAKEYLNKAIQVFILNKTYSPAYSAAAALSKVYEKEKDYKQSLSYLNLSLAYKDSIEIDNQDRPIDEMLVKYETDKKDKAIQLLNIEKELSNKKLSQNRLTIIFGLSIILFLIIIAIILRTKNRIGQKLKEVQMRNQIASDLHDDVGSSLSSILLLSNMAADFGSTPTEKDILEKIGSNTKEVIDKMSDIVWTMKPGNDEGLSVKEKLQKLGLLASEVSGIQVNIDIDDKLENLKLDMATRKNIFLICKEAINNILKHADASIINFSLQIIHQTIVIIINDNGKGFDKATTPANNGTETMLQRAVDCNGTCSIDSVTGAGTTITVNIPTGIPRNRQRFS